MSKQISPAECRQLVNEMVTEMLECEDGTVISTGELAKSLGLEEPDKSEQTRLHHELMEAAAESHITIEQAGCEKGTEGGYDQPFVIRNQAAQIKCPFCGSENTARIIYGLPIFDERMQTKLDSGKVILGGCCILSARVNGVQVRTDPARKCNRCRKEFGRPPLLLSDTMETGEDYRSIVQGVRFSCGSFFGGVSEVEINRCGNGAFVHGKRRPYLEGAPVDREISPEEWQSLISALYDRLYLHEWNQCYENPDILDGTQWKLEILLTRDRKQTIRGSNKFPPYWEELKVLFERYLGDPV